MCRYAVGLVLLFSIGVVAQTPPTSDAIARLLAKKSIAALTGGSAFSDVTLSANVISIFGSDYETGTGTFQAKAHGESRVSLHLTKGTRIEVRSITNGIPVGAWQNSGEAPK